jgi:hypothetical protein
MVIGVIMKIKDTELEYDEAEAVALDYFLGGSNEDKDAWAQRVWKNCELYKNNNGLDENGKKLPPVYSKDPHFLWENKKRRRRAALMAELKGIKKDKELLEEKIIKEDLKKGKKPEWSPELADSEILKLKTDPAYKTRKQRDDEMQAEYEAEALAEKNKRISKVAKLRQKGFDDDTIKIIYPEGEGVIDENAN